MSKRRCSPFTLIGGMQQTPCILWQMTDVSELARDRLVKVSRMSVMFPSNQASQFRQRDSRHQAGTSLAGFLTEMTCVIDVLATHPRRYPVRGWLGYPRIGFAWKPEKHVVITQLDIWHLMQ
jgi:hypothetical protein